MQKIVIILTVLLAITSCKKEEGEGGKASVNGTVWLKEYNGYFTILQLERPAYDEYVYIQYGDEINYGDRVKTNYDGRFEFKYLRPGNYKIFTYSKDPTDKDNTSPDKTMVVYKEFEISSKKETIALDTLTIYN